MSWQTVSGSPRETEALGRLLGGLLRAGDVVFLTGDLGAGKTRLARGIAAGLGCAGVRSPSFTLLHCHRGRIPVYHADLYRLAGHAEIEALDLAETVADGVLLVEWPALAGEDFPEHLGLDLAPDPVVEERRLITVSAAGTRFEELARELKALVDAGI